MRDKWLKVGGLGAAGLLLAVAMWGGVASAAGPLMGPELGPMGEQQATLEQSPWDELAMGPGRGGPWGERPMKGPEEFPGGLPFGPQGGGLKGPLGMLGMLGQGLRSFMLSPEEVSDEVAGVLGMSLEELQEALKDKTLAEVAKEKNVHMADVQAAIENARQQELQKAVEDGKLTQKQADLLAEKTGRRHLGDLGANWLFDGFDNLRARVEQMRSTLAQTLNMSVEELDTALDGKSLYELAKERNVHVADIQAAMQQARQAMLEEILQQAVTDGKLTQEQADLISARIALGKSEMRDRFLNGTFGPLGRMGGFDRGSGSHPGNPFGGRGRMQK